jgi:hypothetical protein
MREFLAQRTKMLGLDPEVVIGANRAALTTADLTDLLDEVDQLRAKVAAVEALEPTWHRGMYGCPDDMFSRHDLTAALGDPQ